MPDITMCDGGKCPKKDGCYRHTAKPCDWRQSYFEKPPWDEDGECIYYWPITRKRPP